MSDNPRQAYTPHPANVVYQPRRMAVSKRVCLDCKAITDRHPSGRCPECRRTRDRARGSASQRGYGYSFEQAKRSPEYVNATHCAECGQAFTPDNPKTGGHSVAIRNGGRGSKILPHCRRCNYGWQRTGL